MKQTSLSFLHGWHHVTRTKLSWCEAGSNSYVEGGASRCVPLPWRR
ncbi:hypothetical protein E2C01_089008 [Portunus trituberculatus]|uniref:Uncharacterized protein n=1 Tax=Portunus trituberculatus TaxID=210409 RepID=A0A5B7JHK9_PORTR|nr:hypothetical protein [Portunus trituberculatus]